MDEKFLQAMFDQIERDLAKMKQDLSDILQELRRGQTKPQNTKPTTTTKDQKSFAG